MGSRPSHVTRNRGRWILIGIFLLFFVPVIFAWLLNVESPAWLPFAETNHGDLIRPSLSFPLTNLRTTDARPVPTELLQGKWTLVYVERSDCVADCERAIYRTRQVRHALGKDMQRIQRLLVVASANVQATVNRVQKYDAGISVVAAEPRWFESASFVRSGADIYLVDPQGYLVMSYAKTADPSGLISDLERLLKISKIG